MSAGLTPVLEGHSVCRFLRFPLKYEPVYCCPWKQGGKTKQDPVPLNTHRVSASNPLHIQAEGRVF